jgi:hypothetical protein
MKPGDVSVAPSLSSWACAGVEQGRGEKRGRSTQMALALAANIRCVGRAALQFIDQGAGGAAIIIGGRAAFAKALIIGGLAGCRCIILTNRRCQRIAKHIVGARHACSGASGRLLSG